MRTLSQTVCFSSFTAILRLLVGCDGSTLPYGAAGAAAPSAGDGGGPTTIDGRTSDFDAFVGPVNSDQDGATSLDGSSTRVADSSFSSCFSPVVDAQVPIELGEQLATDCASQSAGGVPTKGPLGPEAIRDGGKGLNWALTPDFIAVYVGSGGALGYVSKYDMFCKACGTHPVLDETLQRIVGHLVDGRGFQPSD